jgi:RNA polymerase sigma-70 factor (ECF subfamily)
MMDFDTEYPDAESDNCDGAVETRPRRSTQAGFDRNIQKQIEALVPRLRRYARALTHDAVAADDLVQDSLSRALGKIHLWEKGTDLRAWLFTILHNQHVSLRRRELRERAGIDLQTPGRRLAFAPDQDKRLELRDLERALAKLPEEQRAVILLVGLEGMRYEEAASVVNLPVGTVRSRVARGREALRVLTGLFPERHARRPRLPADRVYCPSLDLN